MKKILIGLLFASMIFGPSLIKAESKTIESSSNKVTVVPAKFELWLAPGEKVEESLKITNEDTEEGIFALSIESIGIVGEDGEVVMDQTSSTFPNYLSSWTTFSEKGMRLQSKETKTITYKIDVPKDAEPGGKYASIVISMDRVNRAPRQSGAIARVVSLLAVNVAGDFEDRADIQSFKTTQKHSFSFETRIKNYSISHIKPHGSIIITNIWGQKIDEVSMQSENILPGTVRRTTINWKPKHLLFGYYTSTLVATYGQKDNQTLTHAKGFFATNWLANTIIILIIFVLLYLIRIKKIKIPKLKHKIKSIKK